MTFRLIFELEPPRTPDLGKVIRQIELFAPLVDAILVPDNHLGLPAMSSVAIAIEVKRHGAHPIVALNARDRNHVRFISDLVTLEANEINELLFLYGDRIDHGRSDLTVRKMLQFVEGEGFTRGVRAVIGKPLNWREQADFVVTDLGFARTDLASWRSDAKVSQPVYCGVLAVSDEPMAIKLRENIRGLEYPEGYVERFAEDPDAGFGAAINELSALASVGADGAQLVIPSGRKRFSALLGEWKQTQPGG